MKTWKMPIGLLIAAGAAAFVTFNGWANSRARDAWSRIAAAAVAQQKKVMAPPEAPKAIAMPRTTWNGYVSLEPSEQEAIDLSVARVAAQTEPMRLEVTGSTAYDPNTQSQVRARFKARIDKVYVQVGETVKKGDPLVDLYSQELAAAKSDLEKTHYQWIHDQREYERARKLWEVGPTETKAISEKDYLSAQNDERVSRTAYKLARDTLLVYGLTEAEIDAIDKEVGAQKAKFTLRSPTEGVVLRRDAVRGNIYEATDVLIVVAPLDHFWVWGNVYPSDASRVNIGQAWVIDLQFLGETVRSEIESISTQVDPETKTVRIRTTIPNQHKRLLDGLLVNTHVEIPPAPGRTVVPRIAMVSADREDYVFVRMPPRDGQPDRFERRNIRVVQEYHNQVIVGEGSLHPGEVVAAKGSLILAQMYEDAEMLATGSPR